MSHAHKALIGVSVGFQSSTFVERKLTELLATGCKIKLIEEAYGPASRALKRRGVEYEHLSMSKRFSRTQTQKILNDVDYVVIFWDGSTLTNLVFEAKLQKKPIKVIPIKVTKVVNRDQEHDYDYYIGRGTPWGNPYHVGGGEGRYSRDEAIRLFREYFKSSILTDESKHHGLLAMRGYKLACHCKPLACHGDVIAEYINSIDPETQEVDALTNEFDKILQEESHA